MGRKTCMRTVFSIAALYDGLLGGSFLVAGERLFAAYKVAPPNHWGYIQFPAALLLVFAPTLLQNLPNAALGAVVIAACLSLVDIQGFVRLYQVRRGEFVLAVVCFLGVALIGVHIVLSQAEPVKHALARSAPQPICDWAPAYMPLMKLPFCAGQHGRSRR